MDVQGCTSWEKYNRISICDRRVPVGSDTVQVLVFSIVSRKTVDRFLGRSRQVNLGEIRYLSQQ